MWKDISSTDIFISFAETILYITILELRTTMATARDPVCGMMVDTETAIKRKIGDRTYYFCSQSCADVYTAPERELKAMRRRVSLTLIGVVAALGLRVVATFGLVAAIMTLEIIGGLSVYGLAIFIVSTPIVWIAGFSIIKGAYFSLRNRKINMDVLVASWRHSRLVIRSSHHVHTGVSRHRKRWNSIPRNLDRHSSLRIAGQICRRTHPQKISRFHKETP